MVSSGAHKLKVTPNKQTICWRLFCSSPCLMDDSSVTWQPPPLCLSLWSEQAAWPPTLIRSSHQPPQNVFIMRPVLVAEAVTSSSTRLATVAGSRAGKLRLITFSGTRHLVSFSNCVEVLEKEEVRSRSRDVLWIVWLWRITELHCSREVRM